MIRAHTMSLYIWDTKTTVRSRTAAVFVRMESVVVERVWEGGFWLLEMILILFGILFDLFMFNLAIEVVFSF